MRGLPDQFSKQQPQALGATDTHSREARAPIHLQVSGGWATGLEARQNATGGCVAATCAHTGDEDEGKHAADRRASPKRHVAAE